MTGPASAVRSHLGGRVYVIVMGVSGSGKTTVAKGIAEQMGWEYAEGDDFHTEENVKKMASGHPLTDEDRWPWLKAIATWIDERERAESSAVVTCSALRRVYRDLLREGRPGVRFCHLAPDPDVIAERLAQRVDHYMPASLLPSQLSTLEPLEDDEPGVVITKVESPGRVVADALCALELRPTEEAK